MRLTPEQMTLAREIAKLRRPERTRIIVSSWDKKLAIAKPQLQSLVERSGSALVYAGKMATIFDMTIRRFMKAKYQFLAPMTFPILGLGICPVNENAWDHRIDRTEPSEEVARSCILGRGKGQSGTLKHVGFYLSRALNGVPLAAWAKINIENAAGKRTTNKRHVKELNKMNLLGATARKLLKE